MRNTKLLQQFFQPLRPFPPPEAHRFEHGENVLRRRHFTKQDRYAALLQRLQTERPLPRIGLHSGDALYRDGDYYGRDVNIASRVAARSAGGEVLVTRPVVEVGGSHLEFERIGEVRLKGFTQSTEIFLARQREEQ